MEYDFSRKRHWRRTAWNAIRERLQVPVHEAVIMYLPGPTDEDRPIALAKGFRSENLIAVEKDRTTCTMLRKQGILTVNGNIFDAALSWPRDESVDVLFADLCSNWSVDMPTLLFAMLFLPQFRRCVFSVNMLRGRESGRNADQLAAFREIEGIKHRGEGLWRQVAGLVLTLFDGDEEAHEEKQLARFTWIMRMMQPGTLSYRSTAKQTFDTAIFRNPLARLPALDNALTRAAAMRARAAVKDTAAARSLPAILAHRTLRMSAPV